VFVNVYKGAMFTQEIIRLPLKLLIWMLFTVFCFVQTFKLLSEATRSRNTIVF